MKVATLCSYCDDHRLCCIELTRQFQSYYDTKAKLVECQAWRRVNCSLLVTNYRWIDVVYPYSAKLTIQYRHSSKYTINYNKDFTCLKLIRSTRLKKISYFLYERLKGELFSCPFKRGCYSFEKDLRPLKFARVFV